MPTPLDIFLDPISLMALSIFAGLILWEALFPARQLPKVKLWWMRGLAAFGLNFLAASYLPLFWDTYLVEWQLFDLSRFSTLTQFVIGLGAFELTLYAWHRTMHNSNWLWRSFHQMHHSAERLDTFGAFWVSPLDMIGFAFQGSIALVLLVGLNAEATTAVLLVTFFFAVFQHGNFKTPHWLGYIVQRPESHSVHHGKNLHANNYCDLPLIDMIFGTFVNPKQHGETGFYHGASNQVVDMLLFKDLNQSKNQPTIAMEAI